MKDTSTSNSSVDDEKPKLNNFASILVKSFFILLIVYYSYLVKNMLVSDMLLPSNQDDGVLLISYATNFVAVIALAVLIWAFVKYYTYQPSFYWFFHLAIFIAVWNDMVRIDSISRFSPIEAVFCGTLLNFFFGILLLYPYLKLKKIKSSIA